MTVIRFACWVLAGLFVFGAGGCAGLERPNWRHPGPAPVQQSRAQQFDPYPENEPAPPIIGGRPREFEKPIPETPRVQWSPWPWRR